VFTERTYDNLAKAELSPLAVTDVLYAGRVVRRDRRHHPDEGRTVMNKFDDANAALQNRDWSSAQVEDKPRTATVVQSVRMPRELNKRLLAEAQRRGVTPSEVIRDLVEAGLTAADESATVRLADVRRVIDALAHQVA